MKDFIFNNIKKIIIVVIVIVLIVVATIIIKNILSDVHKENIKNYNYLKNNVKLEKDKDIYYVIKDNDINIYNNNYRKVISEKINKLLKKKYSFDDMLIIYNPYDTNKLGLNIYFNTDSLVYVKYNISVNDKNINDYSNILYNGDDTLYSSEHSYQIIGLVPGYKNKVTIDLYNEDDEKVDTKTITIDLKDIKTEAEVKLKTEDGISITSLSNGLFVLFGNDSDTNDYLSMYDNDGIERVEIPIVGYRAHNILFNEDKIYFSISQTKIAEINRLGEVTNIFNIKGYKLHHDYTFDKDKNILVLASKDSKKTDEDMLIKIDTKTNEVSEVVDFEDMFKSYVKLCKNDKKAARDEGEEGLDWLHLNSLEYVDGNLFVSSRETSSIIKIKDIDNNPTLDYILADSYIWEGTEYSSYLYNKVGDFLIHGGQHSISYSSGRTDGVYYLTFFNNNYGVSSSRKELDYSKIGITNNNPFKGDTSYYYVYKVNENRRTFQLVEAHEVMYSGIVSSVQDLSSGTIVVDSGTNGMFYEYDIDFDLIRSYKVKLNKYMLYRVYKYTFNNFWFRRSS